MIKIPEIITFFPVWHSECRHIEFRKWGIMARHSKIRPMRYELSKWSNKFHALRTERREYKSRSSSWIQKRHENMLLHSLIWFSFWYDIFLSFSTCVVCNCEANNNIDCIVVHAKEVLLSLHHSYFSRLQAQFKKFRFATIQLYIHAYNRKIY